MTTTKASRAAYAEESRVALLEYLSKGSTVYAMTRKVSSSGMSRHISFFVIRDGYNQAHSTDFSARDFRITDISWHVANVLDYATDADTNALKVSGAGMDMQFHVVYSLATKLFGDGYALDKATL